MFSLTVRITKSIDIEKPLMEVHSLIAEFEEWKNWSPWLHIEPSSSVVISGDGRSVGSTSAWKGSYVGEGIMERTHLSNTKIEQEVRFKKPFRSKAKTYFQFEMLPYSVTKVTWVMETKLPFFLFFLKDFFAKMIGMDFERGLKMMKAYAEEGHVYSHVEIVPEPVKIETINYVGKEIITTFDDVALQMKEVCQEVHQICFKAGIDPQGPLMSITHRSDIMKNILHITVAYPVSQYVFEHHPDSLVSGVVPAHVALKAVHKGSYKFLPNVWSALMGYMQFYGKKAKAGLPSLEYYVSDPLHTDEKNLITEITIPVQYSS